MIKAFENLEVWFVTGAQLLYGGETVKIVDGHSKDMVDGLNNSGIIPIKVVYKGTANSSAEVEAVMKAANNDKKCVCPVSYTHLDVYKRQSWYSAVSALLSCGLLSSTLLLRVLASIQPRLQVFS